MTPFLTKLQTPGPPVHGVARPALVDRITQAKRDGARATLVVAPAGFGKTSLVVLAVSGWGARSAWLSLDLRDNDLAALALYVATALNRLDRDIGQDVLHALRTDTLPEPDSLAGLLADSLIGLNAPITLVLDDFHVIEDQAAHAFITALIEQLPSGVHLIITTRFDPPFPVRWRARGWLTLIRADDLRFSVAEGTAYLNGELGLALSEEQIGILVERAEGWVTGLHLAALALRTAADPAAFVLQFGGSHRSIVDYIRQEVLAVQPAGLRTFIAQTSILERMNPAVCEAVTGRADSAALLDQVVASNLFVTSLGDGWVRYHDLFAEVMRLSLSPGERRLLHERAAVSYRQQRLFADSVQHYLLAERPDLAAELVAERVLPALRTDDLLSLRLLLAQLPGEARDHALLRLARAWFAAHAHQLDEAAALLGDLDSDCMEVSARPWLAGTRALIAHYLGDNEAVLAHIQTTRLQPGSDSLSGMFDWLTGAALWEQGSSEDAIDAIRSALRNPHVYAAPFGYAGISYFLSDYLNQMGRRAEALTVCDRILEELVDSADNPLVYAAPVALQAGVLRYDADELDDAAYTLKLALRLAQPLALTQALVTGRCYLGLIAYARRSRDDAHRHLYDARQAADRAGSPAFALAVDAVACWISLRDGDEAPMRRWVNTIRLDEPRLPFMVRLIAARGLEHLADERVGPLLDTLETTARRRGHRRRLIPLLIVRALAHDRADQEMAALVDLRQAVALAAPIGCRRDFMDESPRLQGLLARLPDTVPDFVATIMDPPRPGHARSQPLVPPAEALTERELAIIHLAAEGYSNREIAARLVVAVSTVKTHVKHAFSKLGADSRTRAIARARDLGLLNST